MHLYQAIILAIIQGITEFLPISSTAHLILFPWLAGWPDPGLAFDVALHTGTLIAVVLYFLRDWLQLLAAGIGLHYPRHASYEYVEHQRKMFWYIVAATIPGAVVGFLFQHKIEDRQGEGWYILAIAVAMIVVGLLMWYGEYAGRLDRTMERVTFVDAIAIGIAQAFALFPGVSRSGTTITAGLFRGLTRESAARFSFLLSVPAVVLSGLYEAARLHTKHSPGPGIGLTGVATLVAFIVGLASIHWLMRWLNHHTTYIFIAYRIVLGL